MTNRLRPTRFSKLIGQKDLISRLRTSIQASQQRKEGLGHILFDGPPGLGKTTLAGCVASELGLDFLSTIGPAMKTVGDATDFVLQVNKPMVLFIDEIRCLPRKVEEFLYPVLEDGQLQ